MVIVSKCVTFAFVVVVVSVIVSGETSLVVRSGHHPRLSVLLHILLYVLVDCGTCSRAELVVVDHF